MSLPIRINLQGQGFRIAIGDWYLGFEIKEGRLDIRIRVLKAKTRMTNADTYAPDIV